MFIRFCVCCVVGALAGLDGLQFLNFGAHQPTLVNRAELESTFGGTCSHTWCKDQICGCGGSETCTLVGENICEQIGTLRDFARCTSETINGKQSFTNCSETSGTNCGSKMVGVPNANNQCECNNNGGGCGAVFYTCTSSSCESF